MSTAKATIAEHYRVASTALPQSISTQGGGEFGNRSSRLPDRIFATNQPEFHELFNRSSFAFDHNLANHSLFDIPQLTKLAEIMWSKADGRVTFHVADKRVDQKWDDIPRKSRSLLDALTKIQDSGSWILLKTVHEVPEYGALMKQCLEELEDLTRVPLHKLITWAEAYIFIASPHSVTPFHIDHESTFLFQIHGEKDNNLFDPFDRSVLSEEEIERYYTGDLSAANYTEEKQPKASVYRMVPGKGVHHPVRAPHWVKNGDQYSVTLNINMCLKPFDQQAKVYQANHYLRQSGLTPTAPGKSPLRDSFKKLLLTDLGHQHKTKDELIRFGYRRFAKRLDVAKRISSRFSKRNPVAG